MPPMPPPPGAAGASFFGASATIASVVIIRPAIDAAFCSAVRAAPVVMVILAFATFIGVTASWALNFLLDALAAC